MSSVLIRFSRGLARQSSVTTHPGYVAGESCAFFSHLAGALSHGSGDVPQGFDSYYVNYANLCGMHFQGEEGTLCPKRFSQHQGVPGCCS